MTNKSLTLGFRYEKGSILTRRTIMTGDLRALFEYEDSSKTSLEEYQIAIMEQNCLQIHPVRRIYSNVWKKAPGSFQILERV